MAENQGKALGRVPCCLHTASGAATAATHANVHMFGATPCSHCAYPSLDKATRCKSYRCNAPPLPLLVSPSTGRASLLPWLLLPTPSHMCLLRLLVYRLIVGRVCCLIACWLHGWPEPKLGRGLEALLVCLLLHARVEPRYRRLKPYRLQQLLLRLLRRPALALWHGRLLSEVRVVLQHLRPHLIPHHLVTHVLVLKVQVKAHRRRRLLRLVVQVLEPGVRQRVSHGDALARVKREHALHQVDGERVRAREQAVQAHLLWWCQVPQV
mmetsp:Transcript_18947/g.48084  ORF Transcript_18947/g.48084 Transcript_18947/m.48084 type:complete len:267 (+) Transcript_18947:512-1312(+)